MNHLSAIRYPFVIDGPPQVAVLRDTTREENPDARLEPVTASPHLEFHRVGIGLRRPMFLIHPPPAFGLDDRRPKLN